MILPTKGQLTVPPLRAECTRITGQAAITVLSRLILCFLQPTLVFFPAI